MPHADFSQFPYFPDLHCSLGEHLGFQNLAADDKNALLPIFGLSRRGLAANLDDSERAIRQTAALQTFILDLDHRPAPDPYEARDPVDPAAERRRLEQERQAQGDYNEILARLLRSDDGFLAWRSYVSTFENAIPMVQFTDIANEHRNILRQAALLSRGGECIAIRVCERDVEAFPEIASQILSVVDSPSQVLFVVDCGQARIRLPERAAFARNVIQNILSELSPAQRPAVRAVCMSNSFNHPTHDGTKNVLSLDWRLWRTAREGFNFAFGDYAATHRPGAHSAFTPREWRATVTYPLDESWLTHRSENLNDEQGWVIGGRRITEHELFDPPPSTWGAEIIGRAASGRIEGINSPSFWTAAKVNIHIHRQLRHAGTQFDQFGEEDL